MSITMLLVIPIEHGVTNPGQVIIKEGSRADHTALFPVCAVIVMSEPVGARRYL